MEKVHNFLVPPLLWDNLDFFNLEKMGNLMTPPLEPKLGKIWNRDNLGLPGTIWENL